MQSSVSGGDSPSGPHVCLSGRDLYEFRTKQCALYIKGICADSTRCSMSHSETWPRRNPTLFRYEYKLCPNIQFFRMDNKMQLHGKCHYGRRCRFSHSKEEQLYHPDLYKTRLCLNYPNCKGYYCPFAHSKEELRNRNESTGYKTLKGSQKAELDLNRRNTLDQELKDLALDVDAMSINSTVSSPLVEPKKLFPLNLTPTNDTNGTYIFEKALQDDVLNSTAVASSTRRPNDDMIAILERTWYEDEADHWLDFVIKAGLELLADSESIDDAKLSPPAQQQEPHAQHQLLGATNEWWR